MKTNISRLATLAILLLTVFSAFSAVAQEFPKGSYTIEPGSFDDGKIDRARVTWYDAHLTIIKDNEGLFLELMPLARAQDGRMHRPEVPEKYYTTFPSSAAKHRFADLKRWQDFANGILARLVVLEKNEYADAQAWECLGLSITTKNWGFSTVDVPKAFIFRNGEQLLSIPEKLWIGDTPQMGEKVHLGRTDDKLLYFPVAKHGDKLVLAAATKETLKAMERFMASQK